MARLTGGTFRYERRINDGDFNHRIFESVIHWGSDCEESIALINNMMGVAADNAVVITHSKLGIQSPSEKYQATPMTAEAITAASGVLNYTTPAGKLPQVGDVVQTPEGPMEITATSADPLAPPPKRTRRTKEQMEAARAAEKAPADPLGLSAPPAAGQSSALPSAAAGPVADPLALTAAAPAPAASSPATATTLPAAGNADPLGAAPTAAPSGGATSPYSGPSGLVTFRTELGKLAPKVGATTITKQSIEEYGVAGPHLVPEELRAEFIEQLTKKIPA